MTLDNGPDKSAGEQARFFEHGDSSSCGQIVHGSLRLAGQVHARGLRALRSGAGGKARHVLFYSIRDQVRRTVQGCAY